MAAARMRVAANKRAASEQATEESRRKQANKRGEEVKDKSAKDEPTRLARLSLPEVKDEDSDDGGKGDDSDRETGAGREHTRSTHQSQPGEVDPE